MKPECEQAINSAAGRKLSKGELDGIEERIHSSLRDLASQDRDGFLRMSLPERMTEAAKMAKEKMMTDVVRAHEATIREAGRKAALQSEIASVVPGKNGQIQAIRAKINGIEAKTEGIASAFFSTTEGAHEAAGGKLFGLFMDPTQHFNIAKALFGEETTPEAQRAGDSLHKMMDAMADRYQREGIPLNAREDYRTPQPQEPYKVAKAGKDAWVEDHMNWVDRSKYVNSDGSRMNDDQMRSMLGESYRSISTDGANKRAEAAGGGYGGSALVGSTKNAPRQLFFKDAASWQAAMESYGRSTNMYELVSSHVRSMAKDIAMTETFGRDADTNVKQILAKAFENDQNAVAGKDRQSVRELSAKVQRIYDALAHPDRPGNEYWANVGSQTRGLIGSTQLGSLVGALPDIAAMKMAAEHSGLPQMRVFRNMADAIIMSPEGKNFLHRIGVWQEGFQHAGTAIAGDEFRNGWGNWMNETTHKAMGLNGFDRALRTGMGRTVLDMLGEFTRKHDTLASADGEARFLGKGGITEDHWATWRAADVEKGRGNETLLTPESIHNIPDAKLDPLVESRVAARSEIFQNEITKRDAQIARLGDNPDGARVQEIRDAFQAKHDSILSEERASMKDEAAEKLMEVAAQQMQFGARGASKSSLEDRMAFGVESSKDAGTFMGELKRFMVQFKSVPLGIFRAHFDAMKDLDGWGSKASYAARFVGYSTLMGALATELKAVINGQNPRDMNIGTDEGRKFWMESVAAGGGMGLYGDLFANDRTKFGSGAEVLAGPGITAGYNIIKEMSKAREDAMNGESKHSYALAALRLVRQNATPFANIWYAKAAFNRLVYDQLQDQLSPGHSQQQTARMQRHGASYWWTPGTTSPQSAPDLSQGYQDR
jgi:hypothetical protein